MELSEKVRLEIGVSDHFVEPTVQAILRGARTGDVGDGKIFVLPVEKVFRIRTGEEDQAAVTPVTVGARSTEQLPVASSAAGGRASGNRDLGVRLAPASFLARQGQRRFVMRQ